MDFTTVIEFKNSHLHEKNKVISKSQQVFFGIVYWSTAVHLIDVYKTINTHVNMHVTGRLRKG